MRLETLKRLCTTVKSQNFWGGDEPRLELRIRDIERLIAVAEAASKDVRTEDLLAALNDLEAS